MKQKYPSKVLMTTDAIGGVWNYSVELCRLLKQNNVDVALAVLGSNLNDSCMSEIKGLTNVTVFESSYRLEWMEDPWEDIAEAENWIIGIKENFRPDIIHQNSYTFGNIKWDIPSVLTTHSDVLSWWRAVKNEEAPERWNRYRSLLRNALLNADTVIAPSRFMISEIERSFGPITNKKIIYNACNPQNFKCGVKNNSALVVGRVWDEAKNIASLIDTADAHSFDIYVAGALKNPSYGQTLNIESNLKFLGNLPRKDLIEAYSTASVFIHPAKYEPFGLVILEAALSGCALVLSDIESHREIWKDNAIYFNPEDRHRLKKILKNLFNDEALRCEYSSKAFHHSKAFSDIAMMNDYLSVYNDIFLNHKSEVYG